MTIESSVLKKSNCSSNEMLPNQLSEETGALNAVNDFDTSNENYKLVIYIISK